MASTVHLLTLLLHGLFLTGQILFVKSIAQFVLEAQRSSSFCFSMDYKQAKFFTSSSIDVTQS